MIFAGRPYRHDMGTILSAIVSIFAFRFRSRASLELKLIALQHQLAALGKSGVSRLEAALVGGAGERAGAPSRG